MTDPLVLPLRKLFPPAGRLDVAAVVALILVQLAGTALLRAGRRAAASPQSRGVLRDLLQTILQFYFVAVLLYALLSWFASDSYNPAHQSSRGFANRCWRQSAVSSRRWGASTCLRCSC